MPLPFFSKKKPVGHHFGLFLKENQGIALIIGGKDNIESLVDYEKFDFSNGWEHLVEDVDEVLFRLESKHKLHLEKTIFFVFSHLIEEKTNQIKKPYQAVIKNLVKNLELKPLGFIDCREAAIRNLEGKEEMRLTGILIELDKNEISVFIYKGGQLVFSQLVSKTDNLIDDLNSIFGKLRGKMLLPARIILYNSKDLDYEVTKIISHRWPTDLFVQLPKVEIIQEKEILTSLVEIFNQQIKTEEEIPDQSFLAKTKTGFIIGEDIKDNKEQQVGVIKPSLLVKIRVWLKRLPLLLPKFSFMKSEWQKKIFLPIGLVIIGLTIFLNEYYLHRAKLEIFVPSLNLQKKITILAGDTGNVDLIIKPITNTSELSSTKSVTGKKDVGEAAKGEVTIYNFSKLTTFSKGTKIENHGLTFVLDDEVKVASASLTSDGSAKLPGKAKVSVTASQIGDEGNLDKNQSFKIEDLDSEVYFAKNEASFSGGSKKQIATVSQQDYQTIEEEVLKKAKDQKQTSLKLNSDERVISQLSKSTLTETKYSKEIGEEANQVTLTAKIETTFYKYNKSKLISLLNSSLSKEIKPGYLLDKNMVSYQIDKVEEKKAGDYLQISASGKAIKSIDKDKAIRILLGKKDKDIEKTLKKNFSITGYNLDLKQSLPFPFLYKRLPFFPKNFEIKIDSLEN